MKTVVAPVSQETPAQERQLPFTLPLKARPDAIHGAKILDANGNILVGGVYRPEVADVLVRLANQSVAFDRLVEALETLEPYLATKADMLDYASLNEGRASGFDTASMKAREALHFARNTAK